jgi:hypothetical protein
MQPSIGLSDTQRKGVAQILGNVLADEYVLYTKTSNYHWNVVGPQSPPPDGETSMGEAAPLSHVCE